MRRDHLSSFLPLLFLLLFTGSVPVTYAEPLPSPIAIETTQVSVATEPKALDPEEIAVVTNSDEDTSTKKTPLIDDDDLMAMAELETSSQLDNTEKAPASKVDDDDLMAMAESEAFAQSNDDIEHDDDEDIDMDVHELDDDDDDLEIVATPTGNDDLAALEADLAGDDDLAALEADLVSGGATEDEFADLEADLSNENIDTSLSDDTEYDDDFDDDFDDDEYDPESEPGQYDPKTGTQFSFAPFGTLVAAPSPTAVADNSITAKGRKILANTTNKQLSLALKPTARGASITQPSIHVKDNGHLSFTGKFHANSKTGDLKLKSFMDGEMIFDVTFPEAFRIQITPTHVVHAKKFNLSIMADPSGPPTIELYTERSVFTSSENETRIAFDITGEGITEATAEEIPLSAVMPEANKNKDLKLVMLEELTFNIANPFSNAPPPEEVVIECTARLDHIKLWGDAHLNNTTCEITMSRSGVELVAEGDEPVIFDKETSLKMPVIEITLEKGEKPEVLIKGTMVCKLPILGNLELPLEGEKREDGIKLLARLEKEVGFGPVKFKNPQIMYYTTDGTGSYGEENESDARVVVEEHTQRTQRNMKIKKVEVRGTAKIFGLDITPILRFVTPASGGKRTVEFSGEFKAPNINPIKKIPGLNKIPGLKDFIINRAQVGMDAAKSMFVSGRSKLFGIEGIAKVAKGKKGFLVDIGTEKPWRLSDTIPSAKGSIFDSIVLSSVRFAQSTYTGFDHDTNMPINKGLNVFGSLDTSQGIFQNLRSICGGALPLTVTTSIAINPNPAMCKFTIILPFDIKLSSKASMHSLAFEISGTPSVALMVILKFMPSPKDPPLLFTARIEFELIGCALSATMEGFWHHPFGIKNFHVGDLAVEIKLPYAIPPIPIAFGIAGTIQIGEFLARVAVKLGADDIILLAEMSKFPLFGIIDILRQMEVDLGPVDIIKAIDIHFKDLKFKFAPAGGQIGTLIFEPGISAHGELVVKIPGIMDTNAIAGFSLGMSGFKLYAQMPNLELGPLKLSGKGVDREYGTKDDGPVLRAVLGLLEQRIFMSAKAELLGLEAEAEVDIKLTAIRFKILLTLLSMIEAQMFGESYLEGGELGFRIAALAKLGKAKLKMIGDASYFGFELGAQLESLTIRDIASIAKIPEDLIPDIGFKDCEFYLKYKPIETAVHAVADATRGLRRRASQAAGNAAAAAGNLALDATVAAGNLALDATIATAELAADAASAAGAYAVDTAVEEFELEDEIAAAQKAFDDLEKAKDSLIKTGQAVEENLMAAGAAAQTEQTVQTEQDAILAELATEAEALEVDEIDDIDVIHTPSEENTNLKDAPTALQGDDTLDVDTSAIDIAEPEVTPEAHVDDVADEQITAQAAEADEIMEAAMNKVTTTSAADQEADAETEADLNAVDATSTLPVAAAAA